MSMRVGFLKKHIPTLAMARHRYDYIGSSCLCPPRCRRNANLGMENFWLIFLASFLGVTINQGLSFFGLRLGSASLATAMSNLVPAVTFLFAALLGLEKASLRDTRGLAKVAGTGVCVVGAGCMAFYRGPEVKLGNTYTSREDWYLGCLFLFGSICCWSMWLILQVFISRTSFQPLPWSAWICFFAFLQSSALTLAMETDKSVWRLNSSTQIICCLFTGVLGSGMSNTIQAWCILKQGALFTSMFAPLCTVITTIMSSIFLHEELHLGSLIGATIVMGGLYTVLWGKAVESRTIEQERVEEAVCNGQDLTTGIQRIKMDLNEPLLGEGLDHDIEKN
ncbi:WAT1-related protein At4g30420-like isoform X2 [Wolffia australiana]